MSEAPEHTCHALRCEAECPEEHLMCPRHWQMVPSHIQKLVWATYQPGQCDLDPLPSEEWHKAADAAIEAVARKEGVRSRRAEA